MGMSLLDYCKEFNILGLTSEEYQSRYSLDVPLYYLSFKNIQGEYFCIERKPATNADMQSIYRKMKSLQKKYPFVSFFIVVSTHESNCNKKFNSQGRGRPQMKIIGKEIKPHLHIGAVGKSYNQSAHQFIEELASFVRKKRRHLGKVEVRSYKQGEIGGAHFIGYCYRQADEMYTSGDFKWKKYYRNSVAQMLNF